MVAANPKAPARQLAPGDRFAGKYVLARRIAVGGMGEIWVAKNAATSADVALKVLRGDLDRKLEVEARFRHEAQLGAMLAHRNIVRVFDLLEEPDGSLLLVMELLRGETLRRYLKNHGAISATEAVAIMLPVLSALQHAHEMGIVHRDLKPANILLAVDPDGHVTPKLLDFGIAKIPASGVKTMFGRVLGTPRYMSPEQIRTDPKIDGRSDIFSAGTLLVEMLTGSSPFLASSPSASLAAVLEQQVDPDPRIDPKLWLVINRALAKRPYERYASASEFAAALRAALSATEADFQDTLKRSKPPLEQRPSFADGTPPSTARPDDDDDDDDESPRPVEDPHPASVSRMARGNANDTARDLTGRHQAEENEGAAPEGATGAMSVPLRKPSRTARIVVASTVATALLIGAFAIATRVRAKAVADGKTPVTSATEHGPTDTPSIPPPPALEDVKTAGTAATASTPTPDAPPTKAAPTLPTPKHATPGGKKPPKKNGVAATPDF